MDAQLPMPEFNLGQSVSVILNEQNHTAYVGTITQVIWHHKDCCYNYYIEASGKKISKRYPAQDLRSASNKSISRTR